VACGPLNEALGGPLKIVGLRLRPCQPSGKSDPEHNNCPLTVSALSDSSAYSYHSAQECIHCVRWGSLTLQGKGRFGGWTHSQNMQLQIAGATWRIETNDSAFCQITLDLVLR